MPATGRLTPTAFQTSRAPHCCAANSKALTSMGSWPDSVTSNVCGSVQGTGSTSDQ